MRSLTLTAYPVIQGSTKFYLSAISAESLVDEEYWRVDRWDPASQEGYQREINQSHSHRLARYLGKAYITGSDPLEDTTETHGRVLAQVATNNALPSSIVVNFRNPLEVRPLPNAGGAVEVVLDKWPGYIIDGQHRIEGIRELINGGVDMGDYEFPITLTNLGLEDEMLQFRNLNTTANRPPKGLNDAISYSLYTKYGRTPSTWGEIAASRATGITMRMATDLGSPWHGKIALGGIRKRAMHTTVQAQFARSLRTLFVSGRFSSADENLDHIYQLLLAYWLAVERVWPESVNNMESSIIQRSDGMHSLHQLLARIFNNISVNPTYEDFETLLQSVRDNASLTGDGWTRLTGTIAQLTQGYSASKGQTIVADYLWSAIDDKTKATVRGAR